MGADFYCHKAALVVEVDGDIHDLQKEEDARREKVLSEMGLRIVRFGGESLCAGFEVIFSPCLLSQIEIQSLLCTSSPVKR